MLSITPISSYRIGETAGSAAYRKNSNLKETAGSATHSTNNSCNETAGSAAQREKINYLI